jgi:hypothetical protein
MAALVKDVLLMAAGDTTEQDGQTKHRERGQGNTGDRRVQTLCKNCVL